MFSIRNWEGLEVATAFLYPFLSPQLLREEEEETIKTLEKIYSGIIRVMVLMNQSKGFTVFLIWAAGVLFLQGKNCGFRRFGSCGELGDPQQCFLQTLLFKVCSVISTWEFGSGPTPGPAEVTAQSSIWEVSSEDSRMLWGQRWPTGASHFILFSVLWVHPCCHTLGSDFVVSAQ